MQGGVKTLKKFNMLCSVLVIFTAAIFVVTLAQNIVFRTADIYLFYFNDSRAVNQIYTTLDNSEMADEIASFMNSWNPEEFQVYEDTGYDLQGIFTEDESKNMLIVKKWLDCSAAIMIVSLILTAAIYTYFLRNDYKKALRDRYKISIGLIPAEIVVTAALTATNGGRQWIFEKMQLVELPEDSSLIHLIGADYLSMATMFYIAIGMVIFAVATWLVFRLTRPPRIFY